jgi:hypothetical protein
MAEQDTPDSQRWVPGRFRTGCAIVLSMVPCVGGAGYLLLRRLGQGGKALRLFGLIALIWLVNGAAIVWIDRDWPGMLLTPLAFGLQALSAADCLLLAGLARRGEALPERRVAIAALTFLAPR